VKGRYHTSRAEVNDQEIVERTEKKNSKPVEAIAAHTIGIHQALRWNR